MADTIQPRDVPSEVSDLLGAWVRKRGHYIFLHYLLGIVALATSIAFVAEMALVQDWSPRRVFACVLISSLCVLTLVFAHPLKEYGKFASAIRVLYTAVLRYRYQVIEMPELLRAVEHGEAIIQRVEDDPPVPPGR